MDEEFEIPPHARRRISDRDATDDQIFETLRSGEPVPAHSGRIGRARVFPYGKEYEGTVYPEIRVIVFAVRKGDRTVIVTVITQFGRWSSP